MNMDLKCLLNAYFDGKPELQAKKDALIEKALLLQEKSQTEVE